jgi:hypothetical protein
MLTVGVCSSNSKIDLCMLRGKDIAYCISARMYSCLCCLCRPASYHGLGAVLRSASELALVLSAASSGIMGIAVAFVEVKRGVHVGAVMPRLGLA